MRALHDLATEGRVNSCGAGSMDVGLPACYLIVHSWGKWVDQFRLHAKIIIQILRQNNIGVFPVRTHDIYKA